MIKQLIATLGVTTVSVMMLTSTAFADGETNCQPIYGGGQTCVTNGQINLNKTVLHPNNNSYVDNLTISDPKFGPDNTVTFQLTVKNTGNGPINKVTVKDVFPQYVTFNGGAGNYDANSKTLSFDTNLNAGESKTFTISGKVVSSNDLPNGTVCVVNQAFVNTDNNQSAQDNAQFCIEKPGVNPTPTPTTVQPGTTKGGLKVFPSPKIVTTPPTGPEALPVIGIVLSAISGFILRKKAK